MKRFRYYLVPAGAALLMLLAWWLWPNDQSLDPRYLTFDDRFTPYISAYTHGEISRGSEIRVRFAEEMADVSQVGLPLSGSPFRFSPEIQGVASWEDRRTLVFKPKEMLPSGVAFSGDVLLTKIWPSAPAELKSFPFSFGTPAQQFKVEIASNESYGEAGESWQRVSGVLRTVDLEEPGNIHSVLQAKFPKQKGILRWEESNHPKEFRFVIDSLPRGAEDYTVALSWNGSALKVAEKGTEIVTIPAKGSFRHLNTYSYGEPESYLVVEFSAPVARQDLSGLIRLDGQRQPLKFDIDGTKVKIYPEKRLTGTHQLRLSAGIVSVEGVATTSELRESVVFSEIHPEVRLVGEGVIIPNAERLPFLFESIGLKAIDVRVIKIFEKNIPQFLQVNHLGDYQQLKRVGQPVVQKKIVLDDNDNIDLNTWTRHSLDLSTLIKPDPGAIYQISIGFRKSYAYFRCSEDEETTAEKGMLDLDDNWYVYDQEQDYSYWDYWYGNYDDQSNPCKSSYYNSERIVRRNIMASDLGLIAKRDDREIFVSVTNLHSTLPMKDVELEWYDYQNQLMYTSKSDQQGWARVELTHNHPPFLLVAKQGKQRGYLRMDDGSSLSLSRFDTQGKVYQDGVKGFLYGERGVWRPGDPMYLTFILQDEAQTLPAAHPVSMELIDPRGQLFSRQVLTNGVNGFYHFLTNTSASSPTGNYLARVRVGGSTFEKRIKVETVIPNRLKLGLDFGPSLLSKLNSPDGSLSARWLHGAIARGFKADVSVTLRPSPTTFPRYSDYHFEDPVNEFRSEEVMIFEGRLNEEGVASVKPNIEIESQAPGMLSANFVAKVYEPGGAFSVDRFTVPYSPYPVYAGIRLPKGDVSRGMLLTDVDHQVDVVTLDEKGNPVSSTVEVTLYKMQWKWWWDQSVDNIGTYNGKVSAEEISSTSVRTVNGKGTWTLNVKYPSWGRYLIRVKDDQGHATGKILYIDWPGWAGRAEEGEQGGASMLNFSSDKDTYQVGDSVTLNLPTGNAGRALVTIEAGNDILESYWVDAVKGTTRFRFAATPRMTPTVYAHVTLLQPHAQTANDLPIRLYGVVPIKVEDPSTHLNPRLALPASIRPETDFTVKVSEADGKPMTYTVAIVDEGLLGLTRFETPSPWTTFYQREALTVKTWDLYDQVIGAYGGEIRSLLSIGGSGDAGPPPGQKAERFKPVVMYLGPFSLEAGESKTHNLRMPNYVGEVRAMIVAGTPAGAYGSSEKSVPVKKPLMVLGTLPRVLGPGETLQLPVTLFAMEESIKEVQIEVKTGKRILINGSGKETITFAQTGEKMANFELAVLSSLGTDKITITARSGSETAVYETEIEVRPSNPRVTDVFSSTMEPRGSWSQEVKPVGMRGTNHGILEVSSIPPLNLGRRLEYLLRYPFGCLEQTTSAAFPLVHVPKLMQLTPVQKSAVEDKIRKAIERIKVFQTTNGGLAYWPGNREVSEWGTNYAGHFLLEAEKIGYRLPTTLMSNWRNYQRDRARDWSASDRGSQLTQAYRLYLLALAGHPEVGAMNRFRNTNDLYSVAKWYLAGAYHLAGREEVAANLVKDLSVNVAEYQELAGTYGSGLRDRAIILEVLSRLSDRQRAKPIVDAISQQLSEDKWLNTQSTAYSLVAMARYVGTTEMNQEMEFAYRVNGGTWQQVKQQAPIWQVELDEVTKGSVEFKNESQRLLFPRIALDGIPERGDSTNASNGLNIKVAYFNLEDQPINPILLPQGTNFVVDVTVTNTGLRDYESLAIDQIFPSGWEILNSRLDGRDPKGDVPTYQDQRDDRVYTFFDLRQKQSKTFRLYLNSSYLGKFYLPTVSVEAMYDHTINARQRGQWVQVINPGAGG